MKMYVENIENERGNRIANQFVITEGNRRYFQSYSSMIVCYDYDTKMLFVYRDYDYSNTTRKHENEFFRYYLDMPEITVKKLRELERSGERHITLNNGVVITVYFEKENI